MIEVVGFHGWKTVVIKGYKNIIHWHLNYDWFISRGQRYAKKPSLLLVHHHHQPQVLTQGSLGQLIQLLMPHPHPTICLSRNPDSQDDITSFRSSSVQWWPFCILQPQICLHGVELEVYRSSMFWDTFHCQSAWSFSSDFSRQTSGFHPKKCRSLAVFIPFVKTLETMHQNPRRSVVWETFNPPHLAPTIMPLSETMKSHFPPNYWPVSV